MSGVLADVWGKRTVLFAALGLVGVGAIVGGASVYFFYIRHKIEEHFLALETNITSELHQLKQRVGQLKSAIDGAGPSSIALLRNPSSRFPVNGYETGDEYVTASETEDEDPHPTCSRKKKESGTQGTGEPCTAKQFFGQMDKLLDSGDPKIQHDAYLNLKSNQEKYKDTGDFWWRLAKATHVEANNSQAAQKKTLTFTAFDYADKAIKMNDKIGDVHKWFAITLGSKGEFLSISDKIKNGFTFKEHIDKAVELNPKDATLYHLLGRFCYEVATLSWVERRLAATLFSAPPTATHKDALTNFHTCESLGKPFKENRLFMAKTYIALNDNQKAAYWLNSASILPINSGSDRTAQEQISKLLPKYRKYLN